MNSPTVHINELPVLGVKLTLVCRYTHNQGESSAALGWMYRNNVKLAHCVGNVCTLESSALKYTPTNDGISSGTLAITNLQWSDSSIYWCSTLTTEGFLDSNMLNVTVLRPSKYEHNLSTFNIIIFLFCFKKLSPYPEY